MFGHIIFGHNNCIWSISSFYIYRILPMYLFDNHTGDTDLSSYFSLQKKLKAFVSHPDKNERIGMAFHSYIEYSNIPVQIMSYF